MNEIDKCINKIKDILPKNMKKEKVKIIEELINQIIIISKNDMNILKYNNNLKLDENDKKIHDLLLRLNKINNVLEEIYKIT